MTTTPKPPPEVNHRFSAAELELLKPYGAVRWHEAGDVLFTEGQRDTDCCIVVSGQLDVFAYDRGEERRVGWLEPGQFAGDVAIITGEAVYATARMAAAGEVLHISPAAFKRLLVENSRLSDAFVNTLMARRAWVRASTRAGIVVAGLPYDREAFAIRALLARHDAPFLWLDAEADPSILEILGAKGLTRADLPVVFRGASTRLVRPSVSEVAEAFGLGLLPDGACADVIVVGAGPAGLAAAVYAASEGLAVVTLDTEGPGGQAGSSSKIENYLGFPAGVSGRDLAERAAIQAQKFGARITGLAQAASLEKVDQGYRIGLADGRTVQGRAVVLATGVQYRRLPIDNLEAFEGRGVYYGATPMEAQLCSGAEVAMVGAGNSAGQGAVFLAQTAKAVHVIYRRPNIRDTMSEYLVRRLEETPNIHLHPETDVAALEGCTERLRRIHLRKPGGETPLEAPFLFLFIGAQPNTEWLPVSLCRDDKGFLHTGAEIAPMRLVRAGWSLERAPTMFETSWPRVYAVGDVRAGSVKRVASAVGEGSVVVSAIHAALAEGAA